MNRINNLKLFNRILSGGLGLVLLFTSLSALAEGNEEEITNPTSIGTSVDDSLVQEPIILTFDEYMSITKELFNKLIAFDKKDPTLAFYVYNGFYFANYKSCLDIRQDLIDNGYTYEDIEEGFLCASDMCVIMTFKNIEILEKTKDFSKLDTSKLFDISELCLDPETKIIAHNAHVNYLKTYAEGTMHCESYEELMNQINLLKSRDYFVSYNYFHVMLGPLYTHCIVKNYTKKEISEYIKTIRNGEIIDINKKHGDIVQLHNELKKKRKRNDLEEYIFLIFESPTGYGIPNEIDHNLQQMEDTIKESVK